MKMLKINRILNMAKYRSTKTYKHLGPVAYRQWRADSHCNLIHGYALTFHFEFETRLETHRRNNTAESGTSTRQ